MPLSLPSPIILNSAGVKDLGPAVTWLWFMLLSVSHKGATTTGAKAKGLQKG